MLSAKQVQSRKLLGQGRCPTCSGEAFVTDHETGEIICNQCGLVLSEKPLSQSPEWRVFTPEERETKIRVGAPISLTHFDKGLSTTFQPYRDTSGKVLPLNDRFKLMRLQKWQIRSTRHSSTQRNLVQAMTVLRRLTDALRIPKDVIEQAAVIYRKALEKGLVRGRSITSITAASLYAACRLTRTSRDLKAIVDASTRSRKEISRCYRLLQRELQLKMPVDDPVKYVPKIASKAGLSQQTENHAIELLQKAAQKKEVVGKGPLGLAAAALYIASILNLEKITQKDLANAAGVTEVTVRNRYRGLDESLDLGLRKILRG